MRLPQTPESSHHDELAAEARGVSFSSSKAGRKAARQPAAAASAAVAAAAKPDSDEEEDREQTKMARMMLSKKKGRMYDMLVRSRDRKAAKVRARASG